MSISHPVFTAQIEGPPETIFALIADMPNYSRWLPGSEAFGATTQVFPYPVRLGTTYLDSGPAGHRPGSVTEYTPPRHIAFHHTMLLKKGPLSADIDVHVRYTFERGEGVTTVIRALDLTILMPGLQRLAEPMVLSAFRKENLRILAELKRYVEASPRQSDPQTIISTGAAHY
jgi:uncharacterized protein YndB with AHSA1/START domain